MGSMMKMALPAAAIAAPFIFPGIGAAMGLGGAAAGAGAAGAGASGASRGIGSLLSLGMQAPLASYMGGEATTQPYQLGAPLPAPTQLESPLGFLGNVNPQTLMAMSAMLPQGQAQPQMSGVPMAPPAQAGMPAGGNAGTLADAMFGGQITGGYASPPTADMLEAPRAGLFTPIATTTRIG